MDIICSALEFSENELMFIRQTIDLATISAKDAKFVAQIQIKIENELLEIQNLKNAEESEKLRQLEDLKRSKKK